MEGASGAPSPGCSLHPAASGSWLLVPGAWSRAGTAGHCCVPAAGAGAGPRQPHGLQQLSSLHAVAGCVARSGGARAKSCPPPAAWGRRSRAGATPLACGRVGFPATSHRPAALVGAIMSVVGGGACSAHPRGSGGSWHGPEGRHELLPLRRSGRKGPGRGGRAGCCPSCNKQPLASRPQAAAVSPLAAPAPGGGCPAWEGEAVHAPPL